MRWLTMVAVAGLCACAGDKDADDTGEGGEDFATIRDDILVRSCGFESCHDAVFPANGLVLAPETQASDIVGVPRLGNPAELLIIPGDPDGSYLVRKLEGGPNIQGERMPTTQPLDPADIQRIRDWIAAGAE